MGDLAVGAPGAYPPSGTVSVHSGAAGAGAGRHDDVQPGQRHTGVVRGPTTGWAGRSRAATRAGPGRAGVRAPHENDATGAYSLSPGTGDLPGASHCGAVLIAATNPQVVHQDTVAPPVAGVREVAWTPMPWDDTLGEPSTPDTEPGGEWFSWSLAH